MTDMQRKWVLIMVLATVILSGSFYFYQPPEAAPVVAPVAEPAVGGTRTAAGTELFIYVSGAVNKPGVFKLPAGSRAVDAITAAGGFIPGADQAKVNLAALLKDELQIHVPYLPLPTPASGGAPGKRGGDWYEKHR